MEDWKAYYRSHLVSMVEAAGIETTLLTFVTRVEKKDGVFHITLVTKDGVRTVTSTALVLSTGCRERTAKQVGIHGTRPAGVYTAGTAQYYINILGEQPAKRVVILGSGDIGLIMALWRRGSRTHYFLPRPKGRRTAMAR